ncbi:hypothetical protein DYB28_006917, partial [Aphanomyces astaci]
NVPFVWAPIPFPDTNRIDMALTDKRRNWTPEEDVVLLIQVAADLPFAADKGQVTKSWQSLADKLVACDHFDRVVDGRKMQNRFTALVDEHRKFDTASAKLSGVDQEELEKHTLLDDLLPLLDEVKSTAKWLWPPHPPHDLGWE